MNTQTIYAASVVLSLASIYLLWAFGFRPLFTDEFRDSLFAVRETLFSLAQEGRVSPDLRAYRELERLLNGLIRYAHYLSLSFLVVNQREFSQRETQVDPELAIFAALNEVRDETLRAELTKMELEIRYIVLKHVVRATLPMVILTKLAPLAKRDESKRVAKAVEREAYNAPTLRSAVAASV